MTSTSLCFGYFAECPCHCNMLDSIEENAKKCFVAKICFEDWKQSGGRLGLFDIINGEKL